MNAATRPRSSRSCVASHPTRSPASPNAFDMTPTLTARGERSTPAGSRSSALYSSSRYTSSETSVAPASSAMRTIASNVARSGSAPVGLCGAFTTITRVEGETARRSASTSIAQPRSLSSGSRVTSAPADRATS